MYPSGSVPSQLGRKPRLRFDSPGDSPPEMTSSVQLAGTLAVLGGLTMVLGGLTSWNLFRVGTYHFHGKGGIAGGTHLAVVILGVGAIFVGRSVRRPGTAPARRARLSTSLALSASLGVFWLSRYADTMKAGLERWVVGSYAGTIAASTGTPVSSVTAILQASIDRNDVSFTLRGGFYVALVGALVVMTGAIVLFVQTRQHHPAWRARARRRPDQGLTDVVASASPDGGGAP